MWIKLNFRFEREDNRNDVPRRLRHLLFKATCVHFTRLKNGWVLEQYVRVRSFYKAVVHYSVRADEKIYIISDINVIAINRSTKHRVAVPANDTIAVGNADASENRLFTVIDGWNSTDAPADGAVQEISFFSLEEEAVQQIANAYPELEPLCALIPIRETQVLGNFLLPQSLFTDWIEGKLLNEAGFTGVTWPYQQRILITIMQAMLNSGNYYYSQPLTPQQEQLADNTFRAALENVKLYNLPVLLSSKLGVAKPEIEYCFRNRFKISITDFSWMFNYLLTYRLISVTRLSMKAISDFTKIGTDHHWKYNKQLFASRMEDYFKVSLPAIRPNL